jgi:hypothetical protein
MLRTAIRNSYKGTIAAWRRRFFGSWNSARTMNIVVRSCWRSICRSVTPPRNFKSSPSRKPFRSTILRGLWRDAAVEKDGSGRSFVNRITYEICVLEALRESRSAASGGVFRKRTFAHGFGGRDGS